MGSGILSLIWFLIRVIPKPSRAAYPCQRAAAPVASAFVVWLLACLGSTMACRRSRELFRGGRRLLGWACVIAAGVAGFVALTQWPRESLRADPPLEHGPLGVGRGIHPGRVVWVHAPDATDWAGFESPEPWWQTNHTDLAVVEDMMAEAVCRLTGETGEAAAWDRLFQSFNEGRGQGRRGYQAGERIAIKINLTACNARSTQVDRVTYEKNDDVMNTIDNSPQLLLALLRQLVYVAGLPARDVAVGDPTGLFPKFMFDFLHPEFPEVQYFDNRGEMGRTRTEFSTRPFGWSPATADGKVHDFVPLPFAEANYLINFAVLKGHACGVTVCAKNHYGSLLRCPDGFLRGHDNNLDYFDLHAGLAGSGGPLGYGHYRPLVDLMGHRELGAKTLLYLIDGLFAGYYWDSHPLPWKSAPFGNGIAADWPSSLFASQDPVAIDSVAYDFLLAEWPRVVTGGNGAAGTLLGGEQDYLHEAAQAGRPPSGTVYDPERDGTRMTSLGVHEHWSNATEKLYSRNLGLTEGIELVSVHVDSTAPRLAIDRAAQGVRLSWPAAYLGYRLESARSLESPTWETVTDPPAFRQGRNVVDQLPLETTGFYRLTR